MILTRISKLYSLTVVHYYIMTSSIPLMKIFITITCSLALNFSGRAQATQPQSEPVRIINNPNSPYLEIRNGLLGIVIPKANSFNKENPNGSLAPIQAFIYRDGSYSDDSPNYLSAPAQPLAFSVVKKKVTPEEVTIMLGYRFNKPKYVYGKKVYKGGEAGPGYYNTTISVKRGQPYMMIEEDADFDINYQVKVSGGLKPDQARYRGWSSTGVEWGYEKPGVKYRPENERGFPMDATIDIRYDAKYKFWPLKNWEPAGGEVNSGRYWMLYNRIGNEQTNLLGFFHGRPSRLIGSVHSGIHFESMPAENVDVGNLKDLSKNVVELNVRIVRNGPDLSWYPRKRFQWGVFISTKKDLLPPTAIQPIGLVLNKASGLGDKIDQYAGKKAMLVPSFFQAGIYMEPGKVARLIKLVKNNEEFYQKLARIDPAYKPVWDAWRYPDSGRSAIRNIIRFGRELRKQMKEGEGIYNFLTRYWMGSNNFKNYALQIACLFADKTISITVREKEEMESMVAMMARIVWDNDNVPIADDAGVNYGPANMSFMYRNNARSFFALLLARDPEFKERAKLVLAATKNDILNVIYENGASIGNPHYTQASIEPVLFTMLQLKQAGVTDLFKGNERIRKFTGFYTSLLTPPSVRFKGYRKLISFGDGSEESAPAFGLLASGLEDIDPSLSNMLYYVFENGAPRITLFGSLALSVDLVREHNAIFKTSSSNYKGYMSHLRSGVNSNNETAVWILNGDSLYDHRTDDAGEIAIYALKAPLSLSRSSFYTPHATDARIRSVVVPESLFPEWNGPAQPITGRSLTNRTWPKSDQTLFAKLGQSVVSESIMQSKEAKWIRRVVLIDVVPQSPVIIIYDSVTNNKPNIWSMLFMSEGPVQTSAGFVEPEKKINDGEKIIELPKATTTYPVKPGLSRFGFTGQSWKEDLQPSRGINWQLYTYTKSPSAFSISQWTTTWQTDRESHEFRETNNRSYSEEQQILRLKTDQPLLSVILPFMKNFNPYGEVKTIPEGIIVSHESGNYCITAEFCYFSGNQKTILTSFGEGTIHYDEMTISGGVTEVESIPKSVTIRIHGNSGTRKIILPGNFIAAANDKNCTIRLIDKFSEITIPYTNKNADLVSGEKGYSEYIFRRQ